MAEPIEIIIRKGTGGEGTGFGIPGSYQAGQGRTTAFGTEGLPENKAADRIQSATIIFALNSLRKQLNYELSQYGNKTGNYINQASIELGMEYLNNIMSIGMSAFAGFKFGGVPGAISMGAISAVNIGINYSNQYRTLQTNIAKLNTYSNIMQERSGNTLNNDSRGTYE